MKKQAWLSKVDSISLHVMSFIRGENISRHLLNAWNRTESNLNYEYNGPVYIFQWKSFNLQTAQ